MRRQGVCRSAAALCLIAVAAAPAAAQGDFEPLRLEGLYPVGARTTVTEDWGTLQFFVENRGDVPRQARVAAFYPTRPDVQYTRDVWVPAHAIVTSWLTVGPAPEQDRPTSRELGYVLYDRTDGGHRRVRGHDPERRQSRVVPYRRREPTTSLYVDAAPSDMTEPDPLDDPDSPASEALILARVFRDVRGLTEPVSLVRDRSLPPVAEAFDGIDQFIVAHNRLAADPPGRHALRQWVLNGGTLWVMLDRVDPEVVAPVLGEGLRFQVVGRTGVTSLQIWGGKQDRSEADRPRQFDRPVDLVRVSLSGSETVLYYANGWPAAFSQPLGRGRVVFTTLGPRGWYQPRAARDPRPRFEGFPDLPIGVGAMEGLAAYVYPRPESEAFRAEDLAPMLTAEIGYEVVGRRTAGAILAALLLGLVVLALVLRRSRWPELIGLGGPAVALAAALAFLVAGASSRRAAPPTAAAAAVVTVSPDSGEEQWRGLFAVYNPSSGEVELGARRGGLVDLDDRGLEGLTRHRAETDLDAWHWEDLSFPAGVRIGPFRYGGRTGVSAVARFGPGGLEGRLKTGAFRDAADAVLQTRSGAVFAARLGPDGSFRVTSDDLLPAGQYIPEAVLTDRQQRRQELYRRLLDSAKPASYQDHDRLYVWAETGELPFEVPGAERKVGMALLVVPIQYEFAGGGAVTVPSGFAPFAAVTDGRRHPPRLNLHDPIRTRLRFQLPDWGRAFTAERATLVARVRAPTRRFSVFGVADGQPVPLHNEVAPSGLVRVEITDPRVLRADADGGLYLEFALSERLGPDGRELPVGTREQGPEWQIESLGLEVAGRLAGE